MFSHISPVEALLLSYIFSTDHINKTTISHAALNQVGFKMLSDLDTSQCLTYLESTFMVHI